MDHSPNPPAKEPSGRRMRRGTEARQRHRRITYRLSEGEYAEIEAAASSNGVTIGTYIRRCTLASPTTHARRRASVNLQALAKALGMVNKMGGNLHQIARHLNFHGIVYPEEFVAALRGYDMMVAALMAAVDGQS